MIFIARMCGSYSPTTVAGSYNIVHTFLSFVKCSMIIGLEKSAEYYFITLEANDPVPKLFTAIFGQPLNTAIA